MRGGESGDLGDGELRELVAAESADGGGAQGTDLGGVQDCQLVKGKGSDLLADPELGAPLA